MRISHILALIFVLILSGCTAQSKPENLFSNKLVNKRNAYTTQNMLADKSDGNDITLILAFSGGGTRAAALSYGVMQRLKDTYITINGEQRRLLDEVDVISSVSGGSFTSAYYGLFGDKLFTQFERDFLYKDVEQGLLNKILSFDLLFSEKSRTEKVIEYYQDTLFDNKRFSDIRKDSPLVIINATDLGGGVRFSFMQEYFDLLCSDLSSYPIASAVTASSAVPVVFAPVALENKQECAAPLVDYAQTSTDSLRMRTTVQGLKSYAQKERRPYIHLVDGGITDNLGLLALNDLVELNGGGEEYLKRNRIKTTSNLVIISVDASTFPEYQMDMLNETPSVGETMSAMTDIQLHRYNDTTKILIQDQMQSWLTKSKKEGKEAHAHFIDINLQDLAEPSQYRTINDIPTALSLDKEKVDILIQEGNAQLQQNPEFQAFLADF